MKGAQACSSNIFKFPLMQGLMMRYQKILNELYSRESSAVKLGLKNIEALLKKIGNPEKNLKCIHVGGTNGKGSVCAFLHAALMKSGYKTGLYTSPHLKKFNERIRINDDLISDKEIVRLYLKIKPHITNQSFFEITTALAFLYFYENNVDVVVLEVGLGGRLDATNVITPLVSVITNIGLEHTDILGKTIKKIAFEKTGIIKKDVPLVTAAEGEALSVIRKIAKARNAPIICIRKSSIKKKYDTKNDAYSIDFDGFKDITLKKMHGAYQIMNAATALKTLDVLQQKYGFFIPKAAVQRGFANASWPARMQKIGNVLIDCAHNYDGFLALVQELKRYKRRRFIFILGFSKDKDIKSIATLVNKKKSTVILTQSKNKRAADAHELKNAFPRALVFKNPKRALEYARKISKGDDIIVVAGSIYMIGELNLWKTTSII